MDPELSRESRPADGRRIGEDRVSGPSTCQGAGSNGAQQPEARGKKLETLYFGYTTCPACAKAYGENYVVLFAKVE